MSAGEFREAILAQPANLQDAAGAFREAAAGVDLATLCRGTLIFSGIGASAHALIPAVRALRSAGRRAFAIPAAELREAPAAQLGDAFVLVSQSGVSTETLDALERLEGSPVIAISAQGDSPLARGANVWLPLGPRPDTVVSTLSYSATLQALGMLCDVLLGTGGDGRGGDWERLPDLAAGVLDSTEPLVEELAYPFAQVSAVDCAGAAGAAASAAETSLLVREALKIPATGMETREYLHGPLEPVGAGFGAVLFGRDREHALAQALASYGALALLVSDLDAVQPEGVHLAALPRVSELAAPILQILPVQMLVDRVAQLRGLEIGPLTRHQEDTKVSS